MDNIKLNSGYTMPVLGFGTWRLDEYTAPKTVYQALKAGYRLIDTAKYYHNEYDVGKGIMKAIGEGICKREDIFITTKLLPIKSHNAELYIESSLAELNTKYIDLLLIHQPGMEDETVYKIILAAKNAGKVRSIGISNYYTPQNFERMNKIFTPAVLQNENHIFFQNTAMQNYVKKFGTVMESWYPFGGYDHAKQILENTTIVEIAIAHKKTPAQIILRWQIQAGYITILGSSNPAHIEENFNIFDFELSAEDMKKIASLNKNRRFENW